MESHSIHRIFAFLVAGILGLPTIADADWIILIDGTTHSGVITEITDDQIVIVKGRDRRTFLRTFVREIYFGKSDQLVLSSGDTLTGRIIRQDNEHIQLALRDGVTAILSHEVKIILPLQGPSFCARAITSTDESFRFEDPNPPVTLPPIRISLSFGTQDIRYFYSGTSYSSLQPFERSLQAALIRIEAGANIGEAVELAIGLSWAKAMTQNNNASGPILPEMIYYTYGYAAGVYTMFGWEKRVGLFTRLQVGVLSGSTPLDDGELGLSVVPGVGIVLSPVRALRLLLEANFFSSSIRVDTMGNSLEGGLTLWAGFSIDFSAFSSTAISAPR